MKGEGVWKHRPPLTFPRSPARTPGLTARRLPGPSTEAPPRRGAFEEKEKTSLASEVWARGLSPRCYKFKKRRLPGSRARSWQEELLEEGVVGVVELRVEDWRKLVSRSALRPFEQRRWLGALAR